MIQEKGAGGSSGDGGSAVLRSEETLEVFWK